MVGYSTPAYGYKIIGKRAINFYHCLLPKIRVQTISHTIPAIENIKQQSDGSITIYIEKNASFPQVINKLLEFFDQKGDHFLDTPNSYYKITPLRRQSLLSWAFAFEGCLALLLMNDKATKSVLKDWQFINSHVGGLYLEPYTIFLYESYPKIIHPITIQNYENRKIIEQKVAYYIRRMIGRIEDAQPGLEGLALLSLVETKTNLSAKDIQRVINDKSFAIKTPNNSPFFNP